MAMQVERNGETFSVTYDESTLCGEKLYDIEVRAFDIRVEKRITGHRLKMAWFHDRQSEHEVLWDTVEKMIDEIIAGRPERAKKIRIAKAYTRAFLAKTSRARRRRRAATKANA